MLRVNYRTEVGNMGIIFLYFSMFQWKAKDTFALL